MLARVSTKLQRYKTYAYENYKKSQPFANGHDMKYAVIAPSMMYLLYPLDGTVEGYSKDEFVKDLVNEVSHWIHILALHVLGCLLTATERLVRERHTRRL